MTMAIISNTIDYLDKDTLLQGFFAYDDTIQGQRPTLLIYHPWAGRNEFVQQKALQLAKLGYFAFAVDMYGKGILGQSNEESAQLMQPFIEDRGLILQRIHASLYAVKQLPWVDDKKIAAIGYCFGGLCVLDLARAGIDIKGVVSFHGLLSSPPQPSKNITAKVLILTGHDDPMITTDDISILQHDLTAAKADWQIHNYGHTLHAFTNPQANDIDFGAVYNTIADKRAWQSMQNFLNEIFNE